GRHGDQPVLLPQDLAGGRVHQKRMFGAGLDLGRRGARRQQRRRRQKDQGKKGREKAAHDDSVDGYRSTTICASLLPAPLMRDSAASASSTEFSGPVRTL